jgi:hypothetical protein
MASQAAISIIGKEVATMASNIPGDLVPREVASYLAGKVQRLLNRPTPNFPGSQPVSFSRRHITQELMEEKYVSNDRPANVY